MFFWPNANPEFILLIVVNSSSILFGSLLSIICTMNSIIRLASGLATRPMLERVLFKHSMGNNVLSTNKRWAHNQPLTYDFIRERILLVLKLFDKVDPNKVTLDAHFVNDLGMDSLDHVEYIMHLEDEFKFEIPDKDAEKLITPGHILKYLSDKEEAYKELQELQAHSHHHGDHGHPELAAHGHSSAGSHHENSSSNQHTRGFCSFTSISRRYLSDGGEKDKDDTSERKYKTSFGEPQVKEVSLDDIQSRVMKVCSKYDKIDSSKLDLASHFVNDLGLDSLDHVEILMEIEDEFGLEIPDQDAEKLMRPSEIVRFIFHKEEARALQPEDRPF